MGLFDRLFPPDPQRALARAQSALAAGEPTRVLELLERVRESLSLAQRQQAERLLAEAHETLASMALSRAALAEESGYLEDAAEWIRTACEHVADEARRGELRARAEALVAQAEEAAAPAAPETAELEAEPEILVEPVADLDPDDHYDVLVDMLDDDVAERYRNRPAAFRRAYVELNSGQTETATAVLEELAEAHPDDPVYRFERGRCRLYRGEHEGARSDLEAVWEIFCDDPLDRQGTLSVPGMWGEAMLGLGRVNELIERLDEVADPRHGDLPLCHAYALALVVAQRFDELRGYLPEAIKYFPDEPAFPSYLAAVLQDQGQPEAAIECLEWAIGPRCTSRGCQRREPELPLLVALAALYLDHGRRTDRAAELLGMISQRLPKEDGPREALRRLEAGDVEGARQAMAQAQGRS